jgi:transposase InsO family protein
MHDTVCGLPRILLPRTLVNRDAGGYCLDLDSAEPFAAAELTSRTPETRRSPSISESSSSWQLPLPKTNSASSSSEPAELGRTTMRSKGTSEASISSLLDTHSRKVVGWSMDTHMRTELVVDALEMALWRRKPGAGLIHHTDRGSQYTALSFDSRLQEAGLEGSSQSKATPAHTKTSGAASST